MTSTDRAAAYLDIDLGAIAANYRELARRSTPARCAAAIKADAYGLGAAEVAPVLAAAGCQQFFVAHIDEGIALRTLLPDVEIAVLHGPWPGTEVEFREQRLIPVLNEPGQIERWAKLGRSGDRPLPAILHLDSGINRLGLAPADVETLAAAPDRLAGIELRLAMSHLASADTPDDPMNDAQRRRFDMLRAKLPDLPASLANSSGIFLGPDFHYDMVRPGIALYGGNPTPGAPHPLHEVVRLKGRIVQLREIDTDEAVGYGAAFRAQERRRIATVPVGYADGYLRSLSNRGTAMAAGIEVPVVGRVSMDLITIDVTAVPPGTLGPGDTVDLIGNGVALDDLATQAGTIGYELLTALGRRYARNYRRPA